MFWDKRLGSLGADLGCSNPTASSGSTANAKLLVKVRAAEWEVRDAPTGGSEAVNLNLEETWCCDNRRCTS